MGGYLGSKVQAQCSLTVASGRPNILIPSFNKYILSASWLSGTGPRTGDIAVNKTRNPAVMECIF